MVFVRMRDHYVVDVVRAVRLPDKPRHIRGSGRIAAIYQVHPPLVSDLIPDADGVSTL